MKTLLTTLFMVCLISTQIFSQWDWLNPSPHGNANIRIAFGSNADTYSIVGNAGIIMKTTNDGVSWASQNSGTNVNLRDIIIFNDDGIAVGDSGKILRTADGGGNWGSVNSNTTTNLTAVAFSSLTNGVIAGWNGLMLRTTDAGVSWSTVATPTTQKLYGASFADANNGLAVGDGGNILKTTDGGASWNSQTSGTGQSLYDVSYVSPTTAVASGWGGTIIRTTDGGSIWNSIGTSYSHWGVAFTDDNNGVVVGDLNNIEHTTDGGTTWTHPNTFLLQTNFNCVRFFNSTKGVAVGEYGAIFKTLDGGITWEIVTKGIQDLQTFPGYVDREDFYDVQCLNSTTAVILRRNAVYFTSDNAQTWSLATIPGTVFNLNGLHFIDSNTGTVVGRVNNSNDNSIMKTTDAGATWITQYSNTLGDAGKLNAVSFSSAEVGLVVGSGRILRTNNGGQDWIEQLQPYVLYDVHLVDQNIGYAVGKYGTILKTIDGGANWSSQTIYFAYTFYGVSFKDANNGIAVGDSTAIGVPYGSILRTTNGGASWSKQILGSPIFLDDVTYTDNDNWYAVGTSVYVQAQRRSRIFKSQDAGVTWFEQRIPFKSTRILNSISAFDNNSLLAVGFAGMVLGTTNGGGSTSVEEIITDFIPETFILEQNYPNPFNPSTKIRFAIPNVTLSPDKNGINSVEGSRVQLKIYDILGNEVATLVDEFLPSGSYEAEWNAVNVTSGVYFYSIKAGEYLETKKMVLMK